MGSLCDACDPLYTPAMTTRDRLHQLVDALPDDATAEALELLADLAEEDDGLLSEEDLAALAEGRAAMEAGEMLSLAEVLRDLEP